MYEKKIRFNSITMDDSGKYVCSAITNENQVKSEMLTLNVEGNFC